jgi:hypothetical protein
MSSEDIEILIDGNPILLVAIDRYFEDEEDENDNDTDDWD